ncbi:hypothetical protein LSH36_27g09066 [Paralvinella palmiformis]|uniref:Small ribosomal subunit protein eS21 n=1 Tax=Paralvinella palmiformis TaxID=53620 RepID=A0AAD9NHM2_9ANNE|nr:hypothetical protein LSH36_27g09066 [Paralvinella palmiformis]
MLTWSSLIGTWLRPLTFLRLGQWLQRPECSACREPPKTHPTVTMQNDAGECVDMYIPRKCSASTRIIGAKDHASIQLNLAEVDDTTGRMTGQYKTYAICGQIRRMELLNDVTGEL